MNFEIIVILAVAILIVWKYSELFYIRFAGGHFEKINVAELREFLKSNKPNKDFLLLDVRTEPELKLGKIGGAVNIELKALDPTDIRIKPFTEKPIVIYCESGSRSRKAAIKLAKKKFPRVYYLDGGYKVWRGDASI